MIMTGILATNLFSTIGSIIVGGFIDFYVLSVHYSFLVETEDLYRKQRKQYTENRLEEERFNKSQSSINPIRSIESDIPLTKANIK